MKISRLSVRCEGKRAGGWPRYHHTILPIAEPAPDARTLDSIKARLRCDLCVTSAGPDVRPDWSELQEPMTERAAPWMIPPGPRPEGTGCGEPAAIGGQNGGRSQQARATGPHPDQLNEDYEVRSWSQKFGVTADELKAAVAKVGNSAKAVENELAG